jgi:hypothetical protein
MLKKQIALGYTKAFVRHVKGNPLDISKKLSKKKTEEVWKYDKRGKNSYGTKITLINGIVENIDTA